MCFFLNIETSSSVCSVSISKNEQLICYKETQTGFVHAEKLHFYIKDVLDETKINLRELSAISVSKGPGSYTGLRIGVSAAKGLSFATKIPLISINTLKCMAQQALILKNEIAFYAPLIDARRMEVYTSIYDSKLNMIIPAEALIVDANSIKKYEVYSKIFFFGEGMLKCKQLLSKLSNADFIEGITPSSKFMCQLVYEKFIAQDFEDVTAFEPLYLKDFFMHPKN